MAKGKMKKKSMSVDMTAMCDVSFLLLTFFVLTSTAKLPEPLPVDLPASTVQTKLPESNLATLTVGEDKVFFGVLGRDVRKATLEKMGEKYGVRFTEDEKNEFSYLEGIGMPMKDLKQFLSLPSDVRNNAKQPGIPMDSVNNQLKDWVLAARTVTLELSGDVAEKDKKTINVAIKGDSDQSYPLVKEVIELLREQRVNKFFLVTGLRSEDF